jgi:hypothetical protein
MTGTNGIVILDSHYPTNMNPTGTLEHKLIMKYDDGDDIGGS